MAVSWLLLASAFALCSARRRPEPERIERYLFITWEILDVGFNASLHPQPNLRHPLGNPAYPGATISGTENWVDVVVYNASRNVTERNRAARNMVAYNFAVASNTVNISETQISPANAPRPIADMIDQVDEIEKLFHNGSHRRLHWNAENSMFINWFGINDMFFNGLLSDRNFTTGRMDLRSDIRDYFKEFDRLYALGARKFLTILPPPMHRIPIIALQPTKVPLAKNLTHFWDHYIQKENVAFLNRHSDAQSYVYNPAPLFNRALDDYAAYGAPNPTCWGYVDGKQCLWHDFIHPWTTIQTLLGEAIFREIEHTGFFSSV